MQIRQKHLQHKDMEESIFTAGMSMSLFTIYKDTINVNANQDKTQGWYMLRRLTVVISKLNAAFQTCQIVLEHLIVNSFKLKNILRVGRRYHKHTTCPFTVYSMNVFCASIVCTVTRNNMLRRKFGLPEESRGMVKTLRKMRKWVM